MTLTDPTRVLDHQTADAPARAAAQAAPILVRLPTGGRATSPRGRLRLPRGLARLTGIVLFFVVWEVAALVGLLKPQDLAAPSVIFTTGFDMLRSGALESAIWVSLQRVVWGLVIGVPIGAAAGHRGRPDPHGREPDRRQRADAPVRAR